MKKKVTIVAAIAALVVLLVCEYIGMKKFMSSDSASVEHELSTEVGTHPAIKVLDNTDANVASESRVVVDDSLDETTEAVEDVLSEDGTENFEYATEVVEETEDVAGAVVDETNEENQVIVAEVDVDIPDFGSVHSSDGKTNDSKRKAYSAQSGDTISSSDSCYTISKENASIELVNSSETQYKIWSIYSNSGEVLYASDIVPPGGVIKWSVPGSETDYMEFKLITDIYNTDSIESKVATLNSKLKIKVEE